MSVEVNLVIEIKTAHTFAPIDEMNQIVKYSDNQATSKVAVVCACALIS